MNKDDILSKLRSMGQEHLMEGVEMLSDQQREHFYEQIAHLDLPLFRQCQAKVFKQPQVKSHSHEPFQTYAKGGNQSDFVRGRELVKEGKVALLVLAGGQGSRLRYEGPKGCYEITTSTHKTLYQLLAEKIGAASVQAERALEVAVMTSPLNHEATLNFFTEHAFFGLNPNQVTFFCQRMWPLLNFEGDLFLEGAGLLACGPNGNGGVFRCLVECGIWERWEGMGIESVNVIPIDNPLAPPFDFELIGAHARNQNEITIRSSRRRDAQEKVGVLALLDGKPAVIEYIYLSESEKQAKNEEGELKFGIANLGIFCFSLSFIHHASQQPLHLHGAKKAVKMMQPDGTIALPERPNAWKFEEFIFDVLPFARRVEALLFPRASCFAPLKNLKGEDSIDTVRAALLAFDSQIFTAVTGCAPPPDTLFELAPQFYYPTAELLEKWRGKPFPNGGYIHE